MCGAGQVNVLQVNVFSTCSVVVTEPDHLDESAMKMTVRDVGCLTGMKLRDVSPL
jgi:hypothetical protein